MSSESVNALIGELVQTLARDTSGKTSETALKRCKSVAFGILLGKRSAVGNGDSALERRLIEEEPIEMLHCQLFHMQLRARYRFQKRRCERFQLLLDELEMEAGSARKELLERKEVLQFMLMLRDSVPDGWDRGEEVSLSSSVFLQTPEHEPDMNFFLLHYYRLVPSRET